MRRPKFEVGDRVYAVEVRRQNVDVPCPDCLGERTWDARLPCGDELKIACPTCDSRGTAVRTVEDFAVLERIVGQVETKVTQELSDPIDAGRGAGETFPLGDPTVRVCYMLRETGVGTGRVYDERELYPTRVAAEAAIPKLEERYRRDREEGYARSFKVRKKDAGRMVAYYRSMARSARADLERAERGLAREAGR